jgi:hypothetical protein
MYTVCTWKPRVHRIRSLVLEQKPIGKGNSRNFQNNVGSTRHPLPFSIFSLSLVGHGRVFWPCHCHPLPGGCSYVKTPLFPHPRLSVKPDDQPNPTHAQIFFLLSVAIAASAHARVERLFSAGFHLSHVEGICANCSWSS